MNKRPLTVTPIQAATLAVLLTLTPAHALTSSPSPAETPGELYVQAQADTQPALTNIHLLATAAQARLKKIQWDFGAWGKTQRKKTAARHFTKISDRALGFRLQSELVTQATDPLAARFKSLEAQANAKSEADALPDSTAGKIREILKLRESYDADAARSALIRADAMSRALASHWGKAHIKPAQSSVLTLAAGLLETLHAARAELTANLPKAASDRHGADTKARGLVTAGLAGLGADAESLTTEIRRLRIHYQLNNYQSDAEAKK